MSHSNFIKSIKTKIIEFILFSSIAFKIHFIYNPYKYHSPESKPYATQSTRTYVSMFTDRRN